MRIPLVIALFLTLLASSAPAYAQVIDDVSAVDQYVEDVPTSEGSTPAGQGGGGNDKLPPSVQKQLERQADETAALLGDVATNPAYGATKTKLSQPAADRTVRPETLAEADGDASIGDALSAAASAVEGSDARRLLGLLFALLLITAGTVTAAARQRRRA
jgi:hypothetical protein